MTVLEQYELLEKTIKSYNPAADFAQIRAAFEVADKAHGGQKRKSGEPYIIHPVAVAKIVLEYGMDCQSVAAAMLHDTVEDTDMTFEELAQMGYLELWGNL